MTDKQVEDAENGVAAFLSAPTAEGIAKMFEALTGKTATPEQLAELKADMETWGTSGADGSKGCALREP